MERVVVEVGWNPLAAAGPGVRTLRARVSTTPGRLRVIMGAAVLAAVIAGVVLAAATSARTDAADAVATRDEPLLVGADGLYASLSDADATAATTFLRGGTEPADLRTRYLADLRRAGDQLVALGRRVRDPAEVAALRTITSDLPTYSGLMETARANNRQGFPVGAAYLRQASDLMRASILPAAGRMYAAEARRLGERQRTGTSKTVVVAALIVGIAAVCVLLAVQVFLARRMHRVFNIGLVVATVVLVGLLAWTGVAMITAGNALASSQREGSDTVQVLSAARVLWLRAQADESLALVARGGGDRYVADVGVVDHLLEPPGGLFGEARRLAAQTGSTAPIDELVSIWRGIRAEHAKVARLESGGQFGGAVRVAVGRGSRETALGDRLNQRLGAQIAAAQQRFETRCTASRSGSTNTDEPTPPHRRSHAGRPRCGHRAARLRIALRRGWPDLVGRDRHPGRPRAGGAEVEHHECPVRRPDCEPAPAARAAPPGRDAVGQLHAADPASRVPHRGRRPEHAALRVPAAVDRPHRGP
jgi:hypothetical protein